MREVALFDTLDPCADWMTIPYRSQYWAHALTLNGPPVCPESNSRSIAIDRVDPNPRRVDAALFAIRNSRRMEHRIGRWQFYLNKCKAADPWVSERLAQKFRLFDGGCGAIDEVLAIEGASAS